MNKIALIFKRTVGKMRALYAVICAQTPPSQKKFEILNLLLKPVAASRYGKEIKKIFPFFFPRCDIFPSQIVILSDGSVTTCCYDAFGENIFASVYAEPFEKIWNGQIRNIVKRGLCDLPKCRKCIGNPHVSALSNKKQRTEWQNLANGVPMVLSVEIMAQCNYNCCRANEMHKFRKSTKADLDKIFKNIRSLIPRIQWLFLFYIGESLLHEGFRDFVRKCRAESSTVNMLLSTNGMLLTEDTSRFMIEQRFNRLIVSIHGGPGTENMLKYARTGADYETVLKNVRRCVELRNAGQSVYPAVEVKTVLFNWNDTDELMNTLRRDVKATGATGPYWTLNWETGNREMSSKRFYPGSGALERLRRQGELWTLF